MFIASRDYGFGMPSLSAYAVFLVTALAFLRDSLYAVAAVWSPSPSK
jgi:hypothetical protein